MLDFGDGTHGHESGGTVLRFKPAVSSDQPPDITERANLSADESLYGVGNDAGDLNGYSPTYLANKCYDASW